MYSVAVEPAAPAVVGHRRGAERRGTQLHRSRTADAAVRAVGRERGVVVTRRLFPKIGLDGAFDGLLQEASEVLNEFNKKLNGKIQTNISVIKNYCKAEEYHQK